MNENNKNRWPKILYDFFLLIICHSYEVMIKQINRKKLKKKEPLIIKKNAIGISIAELNNLFINSFFIKYFQNFF